MEEKPQDEWVPLALTSLKMEVLYDDLSIPLLDALHFAACPYSGPIAICTSNGSSSFLISIYTSAGRELTSFQMSDVEHMEWSRDHRLVVISSRALISLFSPLGECVKELQLVRDVSVVGACLFGASRHSGVALLDDQHTLTVANNVVEPVVWSLHLPSGVVASAWTVAHRHSQLTTLIVVAATSFYRSIQGEQLSVAETGWALRDGQYTSLVVDYKNENLLCLHSSSTIHVTSTSLSTLYSSITLSPSSSITSIGWISNEVVYAHARTSAIHLYSTLDPSAHVEHRCGHSRVGREMDGVRLFTPAKLTFIAEATKEEAAILGIASSSHGAFLLEALQWMDGSGSGGRRNAYDYIDAIRDMPRAIEECAAAASTSRSPALQKKLLKAARLGASFATSFDCNALVGLIRSLRVVNECGRRRIGIPITHAQLTELSHSSLCARLVDVGEYGHSIAISHWLTREEVEAHRTVLAWLRKLMEEWMKRKDSLDRMDERIAAKLSAFPHLSFADAAEKAMEAGAKELAKRLIQREKNDERQVECLLRVGEVGEALARADSVQQPKLIDMVLRHLTRTLTKSQVELEIRKIPHAQCVYQEYVRQQTSGGNQMLALLTQNSDFELKTLYHLDAAVATGSGPFEADERVHSLKAAVESSASLRDAALQELLTEACGPSSQSTREAVMEAVADPQAVATIARNGKLSEKQVHWWTVEGLARAHRWNHLAELGKKKSPIGYAPFVRACVKNGRREEAEKYLSKATAYEDNIQALLALGMYVRAAKSAFDRKDTEMLAFIHNASFQDKEANVKIGQLRQSL